MTDASVTTWIRQIHASDPVAAQHLWERYVQRLVRLARSKLGRIRTVADEEDVVVVAFEKFLRAVEQGRFPKLSDRNDLVCDVSFENLRRWLIASQPMS